MLILYIILVLSLIFYTSMTVLMTVAGLGVLLFLALIALLATIFTDTWLIVLMILIAALVIDIDLR